MPPVARFRSVVLDCPDPRALAGFYAAVLGGSLDAGEGEEGEDDWIVLRVPDGPRIAFQQVAGYTPPEWPRADRNPQQFHLDLDGGATWEEMDAAHERVLALGARPLDLEDREKKDFLVYADPAGHPFCLCRIAHA
ncbi:MULTISPECIES: VOC family protein [unclassified Streptomyces]|uniref:VOC family protein n=1 Tax=unclassified Streptomyces TaxID=2593676 RepID=UPI00070A19CF|nr:MULTISPECIES: VOC family protein [unclassified Streptomyces]KRD17272.1 glyoxalase [Streptomyces sp. Root264]